MRIVSLVPSSTETLLALGADVVACTRFCEQPSIAHVGGTKNPDIAAIVALAPDVVVLDREENRREDAVRFEAAGLDLFVSDVTTLDDAVRRGRRDLSALVYRIRPKRSGCPTCASLGLSVFVPIWRRPWMSISRHTYGASLLGHLGCTLVTADLVDAYPEVTLDRVGAWKPDVIARAE